MQSKELSIADDTEQMGGTKLELFPLEGIEGDIGRQTERLI